MSSELSPNTQAILLLTAPLITRGGETSRDLLSLGEYNRLARILRDNQRQPADLVGPDRRDLIKMCQAVVAGPRLEQLLGRGFLLSQAVEQWRSRAIWVVSRADSGYPRRLKTRLREDAPPVVYGCGASGVLDTGGLAVVGSRHVDEALIQYTERVGRLAAQARCTVVSGGARGIDQAGMRGALESGGRAVGVLADSLERAALSRDHRDVLMDGKLVLISPYDPAAGFNVGHAMQRNKLIYALADAALVVSSDFQNGGTWAGAVEQLQKLRFVPVYVRAAGESGNGLEGLVRLGAEHWPEPDAPESFERAVSAEGHNLVARSVPEQERFSFGAREEAHAAYQSQHDKPVVVDSSATEGAIVTPAEELFAKVRDLLDRMDTARTNAEIAIDLGITKTQAKGWLERLVKEGALQRLSKPIRYRSVKRVNA